MQLLALVAGDALKFYSLLRSLRTVVYPDANASVPRLGSLSDKPMGMPRGALGG